MKDVTYAEIAVVALFISAPYAIETGATPFGSSLRAAASIIAMVAVAVFVYEIVKMVMTFVSELRQSLAGES
ncbi:MAG: hypothetical protein KGI60_03950 [Patescibacteria group bacterium]|nr:hypothetical protein [Patescibacteria group bacterium]